MIKRLAHLCFKTDQLDRMVRFYRDVLGLRVKFTLAGDDGIEFGYYFACGGCSFIELFDQRGAVRQWGGAVVKLKTPADAQYQHFCLETEGIETLREVLVARGIAVTEIIVGMDGSRQCWIKDPDGNSIELMEYTPRSLQIQD
jgi:catechol 2,3-dioxygenase-like lactoylglutathione lyase family enzyme